MSDDSGCARFKLSEFESELEGASRDDNGGSGNGRGG